MKKSRKHIEEKKESSDKFQKTDRAVKGAESKPAKKPDSDMPARKNADENLLQNSSPVCFSESNEIRDEYRTV